MALTRLARLLRAILPVAAAACGGSDLTLPNEGQPAEIHIVRGDRLNGTVGEPLGDSLVVRVEDRFGNPVPGVEVSWRAEDGGSVDPESSVTDAGGRAGTQRVLGEDPGVYTTVATVAALPQSPAVFTNTGVAARLTLVTQPSASASVGAVFERQPVVQLLDQGGMPIARAGVMVTVQIATGGGTLGGATGVSSDASGLATFSGLSVRGAPGVRTLIFAADGFASATSAPIAVGVGAATSIAPVAGDDQSATVNTAVAVAPAVQLRDLEGNPVPGVPVVFTVASGGGSASGRTAATDAEGVARVGAWTLGTAAGPNSLTAEVEGAELDGNPVTFSAVGTPGPVSASRSGLVASPSQITASTGSSASTLAVTARDEFDNPIADLAVTLAATGSGNALTQPAQATSASGAAAGKLSATGAGAHVVTAAVGGVTLEATATVTVAPGPASATTSSAEVGNGTAGALTAIRVDLEDAFGNPAPGQADRIAVQVTGTNPGTAGAAVDEGAGRYTVTYRPTRSGADQIVVRVNGTALPAGALTSTVSPGAAEASTSTADVPASWRILNGPVPIQVDVRDAHGNLRAGLTDEVMVQVDGGTPQPATPNGDGTYTASFSPSRLGDVRVDITLNGRAIAGSPYTVRVSLF